MSHEAVVTFLTLITQETVDRVGQADDPVAALVAAGSEAGHEFTADDLAYVAWAIKQGRIPDAELEKVAGGVLAAGTVIHRVLDLVDRGTA